MAKMRRWRTTARWGAIIAGALALAASALAGSGSSASAATGGVKHAQATPHSNSLVARAAKAVAAAEKPVTHWTPPGPPINGAKARGKTVWFIPHDYTIPIFHTITAQLGPALGKVGAHLHVCDGAGDPSKINSCMNQAISSHAGAIIWDSFSADLISSGIKRANAAHIPLIAGNTSDPSAKPPAGVQTNVDFQYVNSGKLVADWVIADSKGKAHVFIADTSDSSNTPYLVGKGMIGEFKAKCPKCTVKRSDVPVADWSTQLDSLTRATLSRDHSINYVIPEYDGMAQFMIPAIQQGGFANRVKIATFNADLGPMQQMKAGQVIYMNVGSDPTYEGWAYADEALRLMTGAKPAKELPPVRLFTRKNVRSLKLTDTAANSGNWYGPPAKYGKAYRAGFTKLWHGK